MGLMFLTKHAWYFTVMIAILLSLGGCSGDVNRPVTIADFNPSTASAITLSPDENTLWVVNPDAHSVTSVDTKTLKVDTPIPVGREPWSVAITPGGTVVVMNRQDGSLSLLEDSLRIDITIGPEPGGLALSPSGKLAYVTVSSTSEVVVVDLDSKRVLKRVSVGYAPWTIAVTDDGDNEDDDEDCYCDAPLCAATTRYKRSRR